MYSYRFEKAKKRRGAGAGASNRITGVKMNGEREVTLS
jgi:hypothetical protein